MAVKPIIDTVSMLRDALSSGHGAKYKRLAEAMELRILDGSVEGGAKLPPHRSLADRLGVTIGTVSRAYAELERMGLVVARGFGLAIGVFAALLLLAAIATLFIPTETRNRSIA